MYYVYADGESIYNPLDETLGIVSPKVSLELGKAGSFQFDLPPSNTYYNRLSQLKTIITVYLDDTEIFRGRVFSIERKFNKMKTVYCEGVLAYLVDSVQKAKTYKGKAHAFFKKIISGHNTMMGTVSAEKKFTVGKIEIEDADVIIPGKKDDDDKYYGSKYAQAIIESIVDEWLTTFDYINDVLIDYLGGYLVARYSNGKNYIDYISTDSLDKAIEEAEQRGSGYKEIEFGTNLIDLTEEINAEELFTVLIPLGDDNLTVKSVNKNSIEIVDEAAVARYGRIVKTHVFDNVNSASTLLSDGKKYLKAHKNIPVSFTVRALDMHFIDESNQIIEIGEVVKVKSNPHDISRMLICTKIEYDPQNPANNTYTFGNPKQTMTERYKKNKDKEKKESKKHASSGGGAGAGAAKDDAVEEAVADAGKEADSKLKSFYDAWINIDPESGHIDLGTLYKLTEKAFSRTGIELNSSEEGSKVDIFAMHDLLDEHGTKIGAAESRITSVANDLESKIELETSYRKKDTDAIAKLEIKADDHSASIESLVSFEDKVNKDYYGEAGTKTWVDKNGANVEAQAKWVSDNKTGMATTKNWVDSNGANILSQVNWVSSNKEATARTNKWANDKGAGIDSVVTYVNGKKKDIDSIATIRTKADKSESLVELIADYNDKTGKISLKTDKNGALIQFVANRIDYQVDKTFISGKLSATEINAMYASADKSFEAGYNITARNSLIGDTVTCRVLNVSGNSTATLPSNTYIRVSGGSKTLKDYIESIIDSDYINGKITSAAVLAAIKNKSIQPSAINTGNILATEISLGSQKNHKMWATYKAHKHTLETTIDVGHQHKQTTGTYTEGMKNGSKFTVKGTTSKYTT